jgi:hypothetical protein
MLMEARLWSEAVKSHFWGNCGKCDSVCHRRLNRVASSGEVY